ncbi:hypothetical protein [Bifidobacterium callitrichidarum]|uniref:Uncharacterized protein n=1 Tax=Bifidobacterium callitrichidarum TaxID=2052941 RepID=A0A2U2N826_9BIFI|nr:hypothetical protein [Bifidobacterium callitrichidarum]PWG65335.1 hypothetical protein DF196_07390 [Bifidobacterium callitrichidarum]
MTEAVQSDRGQVPEVSADASGTGTPPTDTPIEQRYPELADIESKPIDDQIETYQAVLKSLQQRLDESR